MGARINNSQMQKVILFIVLIIALFQNSVHAKSSEEAKLLGLETSCKKPAQIAWAYGNIYTAFAGLSLQLTQIVWPWCSTSLYSIDAQHSLYQFILNQLVCCYCWLRLYRLMLSQPVLPWNSARKYSFDAQPASNHLNLRQAVFIWFLDRQYGIGS